MVIVLAVVYTKFSFVFTDLTCNFSKRINGLFWDLSFCGIKVLKKDVWSNSKNFTHLNISHNNLEIINSKWLDRFKTVTILDISFNRLKYMDMKIFKSFKKLRKLYLNNNILKKIKISHLKNLLILDLSHNKIEHLPSNICSETCNLEFINFSYNSIKTISNKDFKFQKSIKLNLFNNRINCICENYYLRSFFQWSKNTSPFCLKQNKELLRLSKSDLCGTIKDLRVKKKKKGDEIPRFIYSDKVHIHFMAKGEARKYDAKVGVKIALTLLVSMIVTALCLGVGKFKRGRKSKNNEGNEKENSL